MTGSATRPECTLPTTAFIQRVTTLADIPEDLNRTCSIIRDLAEQAATADAGELHRIIGRLCELEDGLDAALKALRNEWEGDEEVESAIDDGEDVGVAEGKSLARELLTPRERASSSKQTKSSDPELARAIGELAEKIAANEDDEDRVFDKAMNIAAYAQCCEAIREALEARLGPRFPE